MIWIWNQFMHWLFLAIALNHVDGKGKTAAPSADCRERETGRMPKS